MKKSLVFIFLVINSFTIFDRNYTNARLEALGATGMIFGEECGSFYLAPTSMQRENINIFLGMRENFYISSSGIFLQISSFFRTPLGKFSLGYNGLIHLNILPVTYSIDVYNLSFGIGAIYANNFAIFANHNEGYKSCFSINASTMYKTIIGNLSISLNNYYYNIFEEYDNSFKNISLKPSLRLGYGKEFQLSSVFDKMQLLFEIDNLLISKVYNNFKKEGYNLEHRLHLGVEVLKDISLSGWEGNLLDFSFSLRAGMKNLFPTFGIGIEFMDSIRLNYSFTNIVSNLKQEVKVVNLISLELRLNNIGINKFFKVYKKRVQNENL